MSNVTNLIQVKKSRKDHACNFCGSVIPKGSSYTRNSGVWDKEVFVQPVCNTCYAHIEDCKECKDRWRHGELSRYDVEECICWTNERAKEYKERTAKIEEAVALECVRQGKSPDQLAREGWSIKIAPNGNFIKFDES